MLSINLKGGRQKLSQPFVATALPRCKRGKKGLNDVECPRSRGERVEWGKGTPLLGRWHAEQFSVERKCGQQRAADTFGGGRGKGPVRRRKASTQGEGSTIFQANRCFLSKGPRKRGEDCRHFCGGGVHFRQGKRLRRRKRGKKNKSKVKKTRRLYHKKSKKHCQEQN